MYAELSCAIGHKTIFVYGTVVFHYTEVQGFVWQIVDIQFLYATQTP